MTLIDKAEALMLENEFSKIYIRVYQGGTELKYYYIDILIIEYQNWEK